MKLRSKKSTIARLLESKAYRDAYVLEHIKNGIAFQIRALRDERGWTQEDLGEAMGKPRNVVSRIEDPNYGKFTIATLLETASAFNIGLLVKFVPFSRLVKEYEDVSPAGLSVRRITSFEEAAALLEWAEKDCIDTSLDATPSANEIRDLNAMVATSAGSSPKICIQQSFTPRKGQKTRKRQSKTELRRPEKKFKRQEPALEAYKYASLPGEATSADLIEL